MRSPRILIITGLLAVLAAWPAASHAATVKAEEFCDVGVDTPCDRTVYYDAAPGEVNSVTESVVSPTEIRINDPSATLTTGAGCTPNGVHEVTCTMSAAFTSTTITLGDQGDSFGSNGSVPAFVKAGPGNDTVNGGSGRDSLDGGGGVDTLKGNGGDDSLFDGDASGSADSDVIDGGPGRDIVEYFLRSAPVTVDLNSPNTAGEPGENDKLTSVESAQGGGAADTLSGDDGPNKLIGSGGNDVIDGRGGDDEIDGGKTQKGGAGDDTLLELVKNGTVACGAGSDLVGEDAPARKLGVDCETVVVETGSSVRNNVLTSRGPLKALKGDKFVFRFRCTTNSDSDCSGKASVQVGGTTVGKAKVAKTKPGKRREVAIKLPASIAKKIRGAGVDATFTFKPKGGRSKGYTTLFEV